jgi:secreted trypsin-like serine protease
MMRVLIVVVLIAVTTTDLRQDDNGAEGGEDEEVVELLRRVRSAPRAKRIIGGSSYNLGQWPWLVALQGQIPATKWLWFTTSYQNIYCGGSLLSCQWVLTAAHCFAVPGAPAGITTASNWNIMAGSTSRSVTGFVNLLKQFWTSLTGAQTANWFNIPATKIIMNPFYDASQTWLNDLALVKLSQCLPLAPTDPDISPVALPSNTDVNWPPVGANCSMQGWGCNVYGGPLQQYALTVNLPVVDPTVCSQLFGDLGTTRLCAGYNMLNIGICKGDSGGPLTYYNGSTYVQVGIASFASGDTSGSGSAPGGFTRVNQYLDWISATMAAN